MRWGSITGRLVLISLLFLLFVGFFIYGGFLFTHHIRDDGTRINLGGSLRFRAFEMAWLSNRIFYEKGDPWIKAELRHEMELFEDILHALKTGSESYGIKPLRYKDAREGLELLATNWSRDIKPLILNILSESKDTRKSLDRLNNRIHGFVYDIDRFVRILEDDNRREIREFDLFRLVVLGLIFISAIGAVMYMRNWILKPLWRLKDVSEALGEGDFNARAKIEGPYEIFIIGEEFNRMADRLQTSIDEILTQAKQIHALFNVSSSIIGIRDTQEFYKAICKICLNMLDIKFIWLGLKAEDFEVKPVAWAGFEDGYLLEIKVTWDDSETGRGPTGMAVKTARPQVMNNLEDPSYMPWSYKAFKRGYRSSMAAPLITTKGEVIGVLNLYCERLGYFNP